MATVIYLQDGLKVTGLPNLTVDCPNQRISGTPINKALETPLGWKTSVPCTSERKLAVCHISAGPRKEPCFISSHLQTPEGSDVHICARNPNHVVKVTCHLEASEAAGARLMRLALLEHGLDEGVRLCRIDDGVCHITVPGFTRHCYRLDGAVVYDDGEALATWVAENRHGTIGIKHQVQGLCKLAPGVRQERNHGPLDLLILGPSLHDGTVVDAVDEDLIDALGLQLSLLGEVARHLDVGSDRREGAWQANDYCLLARESRAQVNLVWREAVIHRDSWELVSDGSEAAEMRARCGAQGWQHATGKHGGI